MIINFIVIKIFNLIMCKICVAAHVICQLANL